MEGEIRTWWVLRGSEKFGPYTRSELITMAADGNVVGSDQLWKEGLKKPMPAASMSGLSFAAGTTGAADAGIDGNLYRAPAATVADMEPSLAGFGTEARVLPASHGKKWLNDAWEIFSRSRLIWILTPIVMTICLALTGLIPGLGEIIKIILSPVFAGGMIAMAHAASSGEAADINRLFDGFRTKFGPLALLGLINVGLFIVLVFVAVIPLVSISGTAIFQAMNNPATMAKTLFSGIGLGSTILCVMIFIAGALLIAAATWAAPALIMLSDMNPVAAIGSSIRASFSNWMPMLVFGLILLLYLVGATLVIGILFGLAAAGAKVIGIILGGLAALALTLTMIAVMPITVYTSFRDMYGQSTD